MGPSQLTRCNRRRTKELKPEKNPLFEKQVSTLDVRKTFFGKLLIFFDHEILKLPNFQITCIICAGFFDQDQTGPKLGTTWSVN